MLFKQLGVAAKSESSAVDDLLNLDKEVEIESKLAIPITLNPVHCPFGLFPSKAFRVASPTKESQRYKSRIGSRGTFGDLLPPLDINSPLKKVLDSKYAWGTRIKDIPIDTYCTLLGILSSKEFSVLPTYSNLLTAVIWARDYHPDKEDKYEVLVKIASSTFEQIIETYCPELGEESPLKKAINSAKAGGSRIDEITEEAYQAIVPSLPNSKELWHGVIRARYHPVIIIDPSLAAPAEFKP